MKIEISSYAKIQKETDSKEPNSRRARRPKIQTTKQLRNQEPKGQTTKSRTAKPPNRQTAKEPNTQRRHTHKEHNNPHTDRNELRHRIFYSTVVISQSLSGRSPSGVLRSTWVPPRRLISSFAASWQRVSAIRLLWSLTLSSSKSSISASKSLIVFSRRLMRRL